MPTTIVCFYIECNDQEKLEKLLSREGYAFYDSTAFDFIIEDFHTLEEIEAVIEGK